MEPILNVKCMNIYEKAMSSPVGIGIVEYYSKIKQNETFYEKIKANLESNKYPTPTDWLNDTRDLFYTEVRDAGFESEISLFILTLLQIIEDKAKYLINNESSLNFDDIIKELTDFSETLPNNEREFKKMLAEGLPKEEKRQKHNPQINKKDDLNISPNDIYAQIMELKTDEDLQNVISILSKYEVNYTNHNDIFEIDLKNCSQNTLKMIHNFINKRNEKL